MTLTREEAGALRRLLDKICDGQQDCVHCPMGYKPAKDSVVCMEARILERVEARIAEKEDGNEKSQLMEADFRNE